MAENKEFYLVIKGEKIIVSEEVYRAYKSSDRAERKRKQRMWRCRIKREKGINNQWKRCQGNCEECQFKQQKMSDVSLDALKEEGFDGVDESLDVEANFIAREERKEMYQKLKQAISSLKPVQREIIKMIYRTQYRNAMGGQQLAVRFGQELGTYQERQRGSTQKTARRVKER